MLERISHPPTGGGGEAIASLLDSTRFAVVSRLGSARLAVAPARQARLAARRVGRR